MELSEAAGILQQQNVPVLGACYVFVHLPSGNVLWVNKAGTDRVVPGVPCSCETMNRALFVPSLSPCCPPALSFRGQWAQSSPHGTGRAAGPSSSQDISCPHIPEPSPTQRTGLHWGCTGDELGMCHGPGAGPVLSGLQHPGDTIAAPLLGQRLVPGPESQNVPSRKGSTGILLTPITLIPIMSRIIT